MKKKFSLIAGLASIALSASVLAPAQATAQSSELGEVSAAEVLAADGTQFDKKKQDFDILEAAVLAVINDDPYSPVAVLTDGSFNATVFAPTDQAFRRLVKDLTGKNYKSERKIFEAAATLGLDTIEAVLLYHVIAGQTLNSKEVAALVGTDVEMASGGTVFVASKNGALKLRDADPDDLNPRVKPNLLDINKGNKQIIHGITRVLRPADL